MNNKDRETFLNSMNKIISFNKKTQVQLSKFQFSDEMIEQINKMQNATKIIRKYQNSFYSDLFYENKDVYKSFEKIHEQITPAIDIMNSVNLSEKYINSFNILTNYTETIEIKTDEKVNISETEISNLFSTLELMSEKEDFTIAEIEQINEANKFLIANDIEIPTSTKVKQNLTTDETNAPLTEEDYSFAREIVLGILFFLGDILIYLLNQGQLDPMYCLMIFMSLLTILKPKNQ